MGRESAVVEGSPAVDQYIANLRDCERRTAVDDSAVVPWEYIDTDEELARLVMTVAHTPTNVRRDLRKPSTSPDSATDSRPVVRVLSQPRVAYVLDPDNPYDQIGTARDAVRGLKPSHCDRCGWWRSDRLNIILAEASMGFVAIVLDRECVDELGVDGWIIT